MGGLLDNKDITLRAPEPEDLEMLFRLENDEEIWPVSCTVNPYSRSQLERYIRESVNDLFAEHQVRYVISMGGKAVGCIDLTDVDAVQAHAQVGIGVLPEYRKRGIAGMALDMLCRHAEKRLRLRNLAAYVPASNISSLKLFEKAGFERVGEFKEWVWSGDVFDDVVLLQKKIEKNQQ